MKIRFSTFLALSGGILLFLILNQPIRSSSFQPETTISTPLAFLGSNSGLPAVEFVSSVGGTVSAVAISNTTAYVGEGAALVVLDVSNPLQPSQQSRLPLPDLIGQIQVVNNLVYVANHYNGLQIIDVQDPTNPVLLGSYDTPGVAVEVVVVDGCAYVADGSRGLQIIDVSNPTAPQWLGTYEIGEFAFNVQLVDNMVYLGDLTQGLYILDVDIPSAPVLLNHFPQMVAFDIQIADGFAYLAGVEFGLGIFDVSDPISPTLVNNYRRSVESAEGVRVKDGLAYVITYSTLVIIDVSEPAEPTELDSLYVGRPTDLSIGGIFAYVADYKGNVHIIDISQATAIMPTGQYATLGSASALQVVDNIAYVADSYQGLQVIDISDPTHPIWLTHAESSKSASDLAIKNEFVYMANGNLGMQIFDVSTPISPTLVGSYSGGVYGIELYDDLAYVDGYGAMQIIDISNPVSPTLRSSYSGVRNIIIAGSLAYGLDHTGFQIIDVSNPDTPQLLGRYTLTDAFPGKPSDIAVLGDFVYLTVEPDKGLQIVDVSDPATPALWNTYAAYAGTVRIGGDYAFSASGIGLKRMHIFDASNPATLKPRSAYTLPGLFRGLQVINDLVFVADGSGGLQILRIHPSRFPPDLFLPLVVRDSRK